MDNVTAGRLGISVTALANAFGLNTIADTNTYTHVFNKGSFEIGIGIGKAFACCGSDTDTAVLTDGFADGQHVLTIRSNFINDTPQSSYTLGAIFIISTNGPKP